MVSVTQRISEIRQPRGGYVNPGEFAVTSLPDECDLKEKENLHPSLTGLAVDYLTRCKTGTPAEEVFSISLLGAARIREKERAANLVKGINGTDDTSVINACKLSGYDVIVRAGVQGYKPVRLIEPDKDTIGNIRVMVQRALTFFDIYGPVVKDGFTFQGGYTDLIHSGDGDFLTADTLWDFKVSKSRPTGKHTLQLLVYYLMGEQSIHPEFAKIEKLGVFNPRLNNVYLLDINRISEKVVKEVQTAIIGY
ncbi:hypothetical protein [Salimicrobium salexigens]|uniref:PD-(D/E)XK endonuclease-like domain-containing protein n=1 Tax=Salimicrobium salexigens TaxID=908941 RepID=A0ABY1KTL5_9BACI|nr:hypothetical protein [Salimicrobium salexigens]SIS75436.1 hypothetical protein SAMN05421758_10555 [Salimicrobium salexigens]